MVCIDFIKFVDYMKEKIELFNKERYADVAGYYFNILEFVLSHHTIEAEKVNHGKLIYDSTDNKYRCSECCAEAPRNNGDIAYSDIYCCYKCGAKMDGGNAE